MFGQTTLFTCLFGSIRSGLRKASRVGKKESKRQTLQKMTARPLRNGDSKKFMISVEGNIASGKTEFLNYFEGTPDIEVLEEPVNKWRDIKGENALAKMYEDPTRWSLTLQTYVQLTMLQNHLKPQIKPYRLMERSIFSAKYCFVENLHNSKKMPDLEYAVLTEWFDWIIDFHKLPIDLIVYLRTTPETLNDRIMQRSRQEEQRISIDYLRQLHSLHEDWLIHQTKFPLPCKVLVIDANIKTLKEMHQVFEKNMQKIMCESG